MKPLTSDSKIFVSGHRGLVGSACVRALEKNGFKSILTRSRMELDLRDQRAVRDFFKKEKPEFVILAAAKVGGIGANSQYPVEFLLENLQIEMNVIEAAAQFETEKLVFLGSSCIYPKNAKYPLTPDQLLSGPFEQTNEAYALAKVTGLKLCQYYHRQYGKRFISLMPTNMYGPNDYYDFHNSHVIPAMLLKVVRAHADRADKVTFWGTGKPLREFLHSDDLAEAILVALERYEDAELLNVGSGEEITIKELAELVCKEAGFKGAIEWDATKPDGMFRKPIDSSKIRELGWVPRHALSKGLKSVVEDAQSAFKKRQG